MIVDFLFTVWTWESVLLAVFGGFIGGIVLQAIHPEMLPDQSIVKRAVAKGWMVVTLGLLFYAGQIVSEVEHPGDGFDRVFSRFLLWTLFSTATGFGVYVGHRYRRSH